MTLGDCPVNVLNPKLKSVSGVGGQSFYVFSALVESGMFEIVSLGDMVNPPPNIPTIQVNEHFKVIPVEKFGDENTVRTILQREKPDIVWMMTDTRFFFWLWRMEDEIRQHCPIVYYHVWDNYPVPDYNDKWYSSCDHIVAINKLTHDIINQVAPDSTGKYYIPHAVPHDVFKPVEKKYLTESKKAVFSGVENKFKIFFNSRNCARKGLPTFLWWFKEFYDEVDGDAVLLLHTNPKDPHGSDLYLAFQKVGLNSDMVRLSPNKVPDESVVTLYNLCDITICPSNAEGFGLSSLESLACGVPVVSTKTGGLQDQNIKDDGTELGVSINPIIQKVNASHGIPWVYEDHITKEDFKSALHKMYNLKKENTEAFQELKKDCVDHVYKNFGMKKFKKDWINLMTEVHKSHGSWPNKLYKKWEFKRVL